MASAPPEPPSPMMVTMIGSAQARHLEQIAADRLGLAALLGVDAGIGARRVDEGEHRQAELLGELHQAQRLAVALGLGHAEVARDLLLGVAPLLVADHHAGRAVEARQPADDRSVVREGAVAVQLLEMREEPLHVVERERALRMARDLRHLPGSQLAVDVLGERLAALGEALDLVRDVDRRVVLHEAQFLDAGLELRDRLLELEEGGFHWGAILALCSIFYREGIERAPEVPGGHRAPRPPAFTKLAHTAERNFPSLEVAGTDALLQPRGRRAERRRA